MLSKPSSGISVLACVLLVGCYQDAPTSPPANETKPPSTDHSVAVDELKELRSEINQLRRRISSLEASEATVSTEEEGYDVARTKFGPLIVSTRSATPYLDGYKVTLRIGNLTSANFNGVKLNLAWGIPRVKTDAPLHAGLDDFDEWLKWHKLQKKKEVALTTTLDSGAFIDIEVTLTPAKPEEIKSFTVGFELDQLQLRVP